MIRKQNGFAYIIIILLVLFVGAIVIYGSGKVSFSNKETPIVSSTQDIQTLKSEKFKIAFKYDGYSFNIVETDNKISINSKSSFQGGNNSFILLNKRANLTLEQEIKDKYLKGYSYNDCNIKTSKIEGGESYQKGYEKVTISFIDRTSDEYLEGAKRCPAEYTETNHPRFFLYDPNHPTKYLFFSNYDSGVDGGLLLNTIEFLD